MHVMKIFFVTLNAMQLSRCAGRRAPSRGFESLGSRMLRERGARAPSRRARGRVFRFCFCFHPGEGASLDLVGHLSVSLERR